MTTSIRSEATRSVVVVNGLDALAVNQDGSLEILSPVATPSGNQIATISQVRPLTLATTQNTTSGTSIDFTGIPSWVNRITVGLNGVSTNGTSTVQLQLGAGSIDATSYISSLSVVAGSNQCAVLTSTSGFCVFAPTAAADTISGAAVLTRLSANTWTIQGGGSRTGVAATSFGGSKTLSGTLDRIRLTTVNGTDTFDAGSVNIMYE